MSENDPQKVEQHQPQLSFQQQSSRPTSHSTLLFGRMDSDWYVLTWTVQIERQNTLSGALYDQLLSLVTVHLELTKEQFVRICKILLLKRIQDVSTLPDRCVRLARSIIMPAPWAELLYTIGAFHSGASGMFNSLHAQPSPNPGGLWTTGGVDFNISTLRGSSPHKMTGNISQ
ncbi:hypothetical protein RUM43_009426 [Polyplax serrata]|uniref:Uncharacterized protein n=1 Tax=Polyplax serrata TaxID=468196 RepID=A0AAN8P8D6_POLSC